MKPQRNEPCPCGSGKKFKKCCRQPSLAPSLNGSANPLSIAGAGRRRAPAEAPTASEIGQLIAMLNNGLYVEAGDKARALVERYPTSGSSWKVLGVSLMIQGKDALPALHRATQLLPDDFEAHRNLGRALQDRGRLADAVACYRRTIEIEPRLPEVFLHLGNALFDLGRFEEAVAGYRSALTLKPDYPPALINLGKVLRSLGRAAEAEESCRKALEINPDFAPAIAFLGEIHADKGEFEEGEIHFKRAISVEPTLPEGWVGIARYRRMTASDGWWLASVQGLLAKGLRPQHEIPLRFAVGKYFDDLQEFDQAFISYQRANEMAKRYGPKYAGHELTQYVDQMILRFNKDWFSQTAPYSTNSSRPVFIVGLPRCGSSLAEQILASHPAVFGAGELGFWSAASLTYSSAMRSGGNDESVLSPLANEYLSLLEHFSASALRVVDKMPVNFLNLGLIHTVFPNARIIHVRRSPIDTCLSIYFQHYATGFPYANDLENLVHFYGEYARMMRHWRSTFSDGVMMDLHYEGLIDDQEVWSRRMLEFIGLPWDPHCLDFHQTHRTVTTASKWQVRQKLNKSSVERWRNYERFLGPLRGLIESELHSPG